ncbi:hypothetical protein ACIBCM_33210 [Streptomyces sp. NPDC051018]|uniref:hypothetical protein n=1 Tax=Streptomyces sp. NPDC051018 TaxID=3365639 RepID=UPI00379722B4
MSRINPYETVARLWKEHMRADFPDRLRGAESAGIDMVMLDADTAGCVSTWQNNGNRLDENRRRTLRNCAAELDKVLPMLIDTREAQYYERLRRMAVIVLENSPDST